jgi:hypothetical protein
MRHDCLFIPNMDIALRFIEARRLAPAPPLNVSRASPTSFEVPIAIGLLMTIVPPVAVTLLWVTPHFSRAAQIALTVYGAIVTAAMTAIAIAALT